MLQSAAETLVNQQNIYFSSAFSCVLSTLAFPKFCKHNNFVVKVLRLIYNTKINIHISKPLSLKQFYHFFLDVS